jgi:hypothetical protein
LPLETDADNNSIELDPVGNSGKENSVTAQVERGKYGKSIEFHFSLIKPKIIQGSIKMYYFLTFENNDPKDFKLDNEVFGKNGKSYNWSVKIDGSDEYYRTFISNVYLIYIDYQNRITFDLFFYHFKANHEGNLLLVIHKFSHFDVANSKKYEILKSKFPNLDFKSYDQIINEIEEFKKLIKKVLE